MSCDESLRGGSARTDRAGRPAESRWSRLPELAERIAARWPLTSHGGTRSRGANFDALRLLAAIAVAVSHCFVFVGLSQPTIGTQDLGTVGVWVFFGISGFLITQSWATDPHLGRFLAKRGLRILPGLLVVLLLTVLVLGPVFTTLTVASFIEHPDTWRYLLKNSVMATEHVLPGVFTTNPYPLDVNGPLWTLRAEVWAYLGVALIGVLGAVRRMWLVPTVAVLLVLWPHDPTGVVPWPMEVFLLQAFGVGAALYVLRYRIPWHGGIALVAGSAFVLAPTQPLQLLLAVLVLPYVAVYVGYRGPRQLRLLARHGDFSYGMYIYAWPVGQAVVVLWPDIGVVPLLAISLPVAYVLAGLSWYAIEKPALRLKRALAGRSIAPATADRAS